MTTSPFSALTESIVYRGIDEFGEIPFEGIYHICFEGRIYTGWCKDFRRRLQTHTNEKPIGAFGRAWQKFLTTQDKGLVGADRGIDFDVAICTQLPRAYRDEKPRQAEARITFESYIAFRDAVLNQQYERYANLKRRLSQGYEIDYEMGKYWSLVQGDAEMRADARCIVFQTYGFHQRIKEMKNANTHK